MGRDVVDAGMDLTHTGGEFRWLAFAGSALTRHTAPPDEAWIGDSEARALCERASRVDHVAFGMVIPAPWRQWWAEIEEEERAAVWRGCRALWARMTGPRW